MRNSVPFTAISSIQQRLQHALSRQVHLPSQVLPLRNESLVNRAGEQGDAVPTHLIAEVLASHADLWGAGESAEGDRTRPPPPG